MMLSYFSFFEHFYCESGLYVLVYIETIKCSSLELIFQGAI